MAPPISFRGGINRAIAGLLRRISMQSALYVSLSAQLATEKRLVSIANNIANMNTGGFRADEIKFEEVLSRAGASPVAFSSTGANFISRRAGAITKTDNPLDVAIQGEAFIAFSTPNGTAYTRDGRLKMAENGNLQTIDGFQVLDAGGAPIALAPDGGDATIGRDGSITQNNVAVGTLGLFTIPHDAKLSRAGNSGVMPSKPTEVVQDFTSTAVLQGHSEGSNVNPMMELTKLITLQRTFESANATIKETEDSVMSAIRTLGPST